MHFSASACKKLQLHADYFYQNADFSCEIKSDKKPLYNKMLETVNEYDRDHHADLFQHTGYKQVLLNGISAIAWILVAPVMLVKSIITGSPIFKLGNTTQTLLANDIIPAFKHDKNRGPVCLNACPYC